MIGAGQRALWLEGAHPSSDRKPVSASLRGSAGSREEDQAAARRRNRARLRLPQGQAGTVVLSAGEAKAGRLGERAQWRYSTESRWIG